MHRSKIRITVLAVLSLFLLPGEVQAGLERQPNTTLQMPQSLPDQGFTFTNALGGLLFTNPVCIASPPGETNRLFVLEKRGRMIVITNLAEPTRTMFMDISDRVHTSDHVYDERGLTGLVFHPGYATNRIFFLFYVGTATTADGSGRHDVLSRFQTSPDNPNLGLPASEERLMVQFDEHDTHNAGSLLFGLDGYLYVSLGDEGAADDSLGNSQLITNDFFSAIMRIDVDGRPDSLPPNPHPASTGLYGIPPDNPFIGATNFHGQEINPGDVRIEFWAVGLRNPWKMSMDEETGIIYFGDVGQNVREEVNILTKGANYGWNYMEGTRAGPRYSERPAEFEHALPLHEYSRAEGASVIGGVVYRGEHFSELYGAYIFGDFSSGRIWALRHSGTEVTEKRLLLRDDLNPNGLAGIASFGIDPSNGDVLYADVQNRTNGSIKRIIRAEGTGGADFPPTLADTGAFSDLETLTPSAGVVDYDINVPFWSDEALKSRWFSLPDTDLTIGFERDANWSFPTGTVWVKHFELELTNGVPSSRRRLETRFIVKYPAGVHGVTYRWDESLTNATLVPEEGMDETFVIDNGGGILRTQVWHYPSRVECLRCHTESSGFALGFNTGQLNRDHEYGAAVTNQIQALSDAGYFAEPVTAVNALRALAPANDESVSLNYRVRSYLAANCAQCHQPDGSAQGAMWDARITTPTHEAGIINGLLNSGGGDPQNRVIVPGDPAHSAMLARISSPGSQRMPPLASNVLDTNAMNLLNRWITEELADYRSFSEFQEFYFGSTEAPEAAAEVDSDLDLASNFYEWLTGTVPTNGASVWKAAAELAGEKIQISFDQLANRAFVVQTTTNLVSDDGWEPVAVPENTPRFSITNRSAAVEVEIDDAPMRAYRVKIISP